MITLIEGGFFAGGRELVKNRIAKLCENERKAFLIVPEQDTVSSENEMADFLPANAPLFVEATNFTRFSDVIFRSLGGSCEKNADSVKRALVMWKTLTELSPVLETSSRRGDVSHGSVSKMLATVKQLQSFAISPENLAEAELTVAEHSEDGRLRAKLADISKIMTLYNSLMKEKLSSAEDEILVAVKKLTEAEADFLTDTEIFIDGFTSFTEPQYRMISALAKRCNITVSLILPKASFDSYEYTEARDTHKKLVSLATKIGVEVKLEKIDGRFGTSSLLISEITNLLWKSNGRLDGDALKDSESLRIFEAETPYDECDFVASDIRRRVMNGADYSDFGVIARNTDSYRGIVDVAFKKADVPFFLSQKTDVSSFEAIKLIYSALSAVSGGFARADVIAYAKCSLSGLDRELADELELYAEKWQINGKRFTDGITWNMNPSGYSERRREGDDEKLLRIDSARNTLISPLTILLDGVSKAETVKDHATALIDFLTFLDVENKLKDKSKEDKLLFGGANENERIWKTICTALDSLCDVLGDAKVPPETFLCLLKITFSETNIGKIPAFTEEVVIESANVARMKDKKHVYIIGANAGVFPATADDDSFFTDKDKRTLSALGLPIEEDAGLKGAQELYYFTRSLSFAQNDVTITYSKADASFKASSASDALTRIRSLTGGAIVPKSISSLTSAEKTYSPEYAIEHISVCDPEYEEIKGALTSLGYADTISVSEGEIKNAALKLSENSLDALYGKSIPMTQSKLELFAKCPMNYFCSYNVGLKDNERAEFDARNIGNFLHAVLENFFRKLKTMGKSIATISEDEKLSLIRSVADDYISKCFEGIPKTSMRLKNTVDKLCAYTKPIIDNLCDEFSDCEYEPTFFELEIDGKRPDKPSPVVFNTDTGKSIYITGKIDRVDTLVKEDKIYVRVVDYKSGKKVFSPSDIERGMNLQMFLYLKSVVDTDKDDFKKAIDSDTTKELVPAGVLYVKTSVDDVKAQHNTPSDVFDAAKDTRQRLGMVLDDSDSLAAMNVNYIPIRFKKDGDVDSRTKKYLYTESGWDRISKAIEDSVKNICNRMISGSIDALPLSKNNGKSDVCEYCKFKAICRNAN